MRGAGERQIEVHGLAAILYTATLDASATPGARAALAADLEPAIGDTIGDTKISTYKQREAAHNLFFVEFDSSRGLHNTNYAIQLLQPSTLAIQPGLLPRACILLE